MKTRERIIHKLSHVTIESLCMYCNDPNMGCVNVEDERCTCEPLSCDCHEQCICECHEWQRLVRAARTCLEIAERKLGIANEY